MLRPSSDCEIFDNKYIFSTVPSTYEELQMLLAGRSPEHQGVVVERIIKCTHPSLASGNKEKLSSLFSFLMQHLHDSGAADEDENVSVWDVQDNVCL